ncbi:hypothetical protein DIPPA_28906 [Diplonema papillatum]|nr:hypothetical protein DIPPA_28906 [Diplonema papillatum]
MANQHQQSFNVTKQFEPYYIEPKLDTPSVRAAAKTRDDLCVRQIKTEGEYNRIKQTAERDDQVAVFKYVRDDCPACAVVSVAVEKMCKKYAHYAYLRFYEVNENVLPTVAQQAPKTPHIDALLGKQQTTAEVDAAPGIEIRRAAMERVENLANVEKMSGRNVSKDEMQKMMMKSLIEPATKQGEESLMKVLMEFNRPKATSYFSVPV